MKEFDGMWWMTENLRYAGDFNVVDINVSSQTEPYIYIPPINGEDPVSTYGYLYNWTAFLNGGYATDMETHEDFAQIQGVCLEGWHIPNIQEWYVLLYGSLENELDDWGPVLAGGADFWQNGTFTQMAHFGESGFNALPINANGTVAEFGVRNTSAGSPMIIMIYSERNVTGFLSQAQRSDMFSVRCVKNY